MGSYANNIDRSQLIYQLDRNKFLRLPADANIAIYDSFNYRYDMDDDPAIGYVPTPVNYAIFTAAYQHTAINRINYHGTRELPWISFSMCHRIEC